MLAFFRARFLLCAGFLLCVHAPFVASAAYNRAVAQSRRGLLRRPLSTQILLLQLAIIVLTVGTGLAVSIFQARKQLDTQSGEQSLAIARSVSAVPEIRRAFATPRPWTTIQPIAERIRKATGASFIVVANKDAIRYSHPDPEKIGKKISTDPSVPLAGKTYVGVQTGSLGKSVRAKVPLYDTNGKVIGLVSVGLLEEKVTAKLISDLPVILIPPALGLGLGVLGSFLLARRIKRQTFGLEPNEIATLLEQREAMLHGIREGAVAIDGTGASRSSTTRRSGCSDWMARLWGASSPNSCRPDTCARCCSATSTSGTRSSSSMTACSW